MAPKRIYLLALAGACIALARAPSSLNQEELKLLQDPGGWEYVTVSQPDSGFQTQHVCFDGKPHPRECSGSLLLRPNNTFTMQLTIRGKKVDRHGTYDLNNDQIAFYDEFGTRDGPYTVQLSAELKRLTLSMPQVKLDLELESQYKDDLQKKKAPAPTKD